MLFALGTTTSYVRLPCKIAESFARKKNIHFYEPKKGKRAQTALQKSWRIQGREQLGFSRLRSSSSSSFLRALRRENWNLRSYFSLSRQRRRRIEKEEEVYISTGERWNKSWWKGERSLYRFSSFSSFRGSFATPKSDFCLCSSVFRYHPSAPPFTLHTRQKKLQRGGDL